MRSLPDNNFLNHIAGECTNIATCWKLIRRDGITLGFTDYESNITYQSFTYKAKTGFQPTTVQMRTDFSVDNMEVEGILNSAEINEADIQAGLYDYAELEIHMVNYANPLQNGILLKRGWIGEVQINRNQFVAEMRGIAQKLSQNIGRIYSPSCDATLGDVRCKVNLAPFTGAGVVASVINNARFITTIPTGDNRYFKGGLLTWTSGNNVGKSVEVKEFIGNEIELTLPMGKNIVLGNPFAVIAGCDKSRETCLSKFNNILNFRGFPDLPGQDKIFSTSTTRNNLGNGA